MSTGRRSDLSSSPVNPGSKAPFLRRHGVSLLGLGVTIALIAWLFRDTDPAEVWAHVRGAHWGLLALAVGVTTLTFPVRAVRWRHLLAPVQPDSPFRSRFAAVCVGFMANNLLPARAGELVRAFAYGRLEPVGVVTTASTLVVERFLDGVAILVLMFAALGAAGIPTSELPGAFGAGARLLVAFLAVVLVVAVTLVAVPERAQAAFAVPARALLPGRAAQAVVRLMGSVVEGFASLRGWRTVLPAAGWSLGVWLLQSLSFWIGFAAFGVDLPFAAALLTNAAVAMAVAVPSLPGYVGSFHAAVTVVLNDIYGVADSAALGFAVGWHLGAFVPVTVIGLWYAHAIGLSLREVGRGR